MRMRLLPVAAVLLLGLAGCKDEALRNATRAAINEDRAYILKEGNAICQLEALARGAGWTVDDTKALCPAGATDPPGAPPPLPPDWPDDADQ